MPFWSGLSRATKPQAPIALARSTAMCCCSTVAKAKTHHPELFYEDRFWEQYVGRNLVSDPIVAIVELVANAWDAGAKRVDVAWPSDTGDPLRIADDGEGMTTEEFYRRWGTLSYDRLKTQGATVDVQIDGGTRKRRVFGRNGIGRFAAFCFGNQYTVETTKNGATVEFRVEKGTDKPLKFKLLSENSSHGHGTTINVPKVVGSMLPADTIRTELGRRFLTDPTFEVHLNNVRIDFEDIEEKGLEMLSVPVPELETTITVRVIDAKRTDRTVRQHGVAWHVLGRLVGDCDWKDPEQKSLIDGRRVEAKRFTFIVDADILGESEAVAPDWSGFIENNDAFKSVNRAVQSAITKRLLEATTEKRSEITRTIRRTFASDVRNLSPLRREHWNVFVDKVQEACPSLTENELKSVAGVLATMELAGSQYQLLHTLNLLKPEQIDDLHEFLEDWTVDMAKAVLDEIKTRLTLVDQLRKKTSDASADEVQDLQPLFHKGLWIFGPEFETIHFTSNEGMTRVIQELYPTSKIRGSRNRPDFAIVPDGSVGIYSYDEYDQEGGETGPAKIVIIELKAPDVTIGEEEKAQCYKYVRELAAKGLLTNRTHVRGFVLGKTINPVDRGEKTEMDNRVRILPLDFETILRRAHSRLLNLYDKVRSAPFLKEHGIDEFLSEASAEELDFSDASAPTPPSKAAKSAPKPVEQPI